MINAKCKSREDAAKRIKAGEEIYTASESLITYDEAEIWKGNTPYRIDGRMPLVWGHVNVEDFKIKEDWRDNIGEGVLCEVWDDKRVPDCPLHRVIKYLEEELYMDMATFQWVNAEPVPLDSKLIYRESETNG